MLHKAFCRKAFFVTAQPQAINRIRCRPIQESDLGGLAELLARGFPISCRRYWTDGFARWKYLPEIEGLPRYGCLLDGGAGPVGVLLLLSSRRGEHIVSNVSSWYVEPEWRAHSTLLVSAATKLKHVTYVNASPAPHTERTLEALGFAPYNFGRSAVFALPGRGTVDETIPDELPEAQLLRDHRALGMVSLVVEKDGILSPFVLKPRRLEKPPVPVMDVIYCRSPEDFARCMPALGRHFLPRALGFLIDGDMPGLSHYVEGKERRYYKGPRRPTLGDLAYSEKVIFG